MDKRTIAMLVFLAVIAAAVIGSAVFAITFDNFKVPPPMLFSLFATIDPGSTYTNTFEMDTTGINETIQSCREPEYYQFGSCDYLYKCFIILPENCEYLECAIDYDCAEIISLSNPETITVSYTATVNDISKSYAVGAFVMRSHMEYDFVNKVWSDTTTPYENTKVYDSITVSGAPIPPLAEPLKKLVEFVADLLNQLKEWICATFKVWC